MGVFEIHVGVAMNRPPRTDEVRKYLITADRPIDAELLACQWAAASTGVVMPVSSRVVTTTGTDSADRRSTILAALVNSVDTPVFQTGAAGSIPAGRSARR